MNSRICTPTFHGLFSPRYGLEVKLCEAPEIPHPMRTALHDLDLTHLWMVYPGADAYQVEKKISVLPLQKINEWTLNIGHSKFTENSLGVRKNE